MKKEIEAKYFINSKDEIRKALQELKLNLIKPEFLMKRKTFHSKTEAGWLRVRNEGDKITMTYKNITGSGIDNVNEIETTVGSFEKASAIINQTSFKETSYQENYREIWQNTEVEIVIDTWPYLQPYIEIEAKNKDIVEKYSSLLGFNLEHDAYFGSVDVLYKKQFNIPKDIFVNIKTITFNNKEFEQILQRYKIIL